MWSEKFEKSQKCKNVENMEKCDKLNKIKKLNNDAKKDSWNVKKKWKISKTSK